MTTHDGLRIGVVGLGFGAEFVPIYRAHPLVAEVHVADPDAALRDRVAEAVPVDGVADSLDRLLGSGVDAVHIVTDLTLHAEHVIAALEAGVHVACTVPMALTFDDLQRIVDARARSGRRYMMMETAVFTREFLLARRLLDDGVLGTIVAARGTHFQDMTGWPRYWSGLPPMHYATHAVAPVLHLLDAPAARVRAVGAGALRPEHRGDHGPSFPVEAALVEVAGRDVVVELTRSLFQLARPYTEAFSIYGDRGGFEWPQLEHESPLVFGMGDATGDRGRPITAERMPAPDRGDLLPPRLRRFTTAVEDPQHRSFLQGGGHGGSHPHLVHEFVSSVVEDRAPTVDHLRAANWTATGIAAHASALAGGDPVVVPSFGP